MLDEGVLRRLFHDAVARSGAVGAQLSVVKADQQIDLAAGYAHGRHRIPMTTGTLIQIGSITKVLNAMIVVSLVDDGVLDLDAPVRSYLPSFEVSDVEASRTLTLRHLISMSSGLDNGPYVYFGGGEDALGRYVSSLSSLPQHFAPGRHFGYSNAGVCVAGHTAAHVSGKPWEALLWERILNPAGLAQAATLEADLLYQIVSAGHASVSGSDALQIVDPVFTMVRGRAPSGPSLAMSTRDLARVGRIFVHAGLAETGAQILSASAIEQMMTPQICVPTRKYGTHWCLGPYADNWNGVEVWGHGGTTHTSTSFLYWIPEQQGVIAFIVNTHSAMAEFSRIMFDEVMSAAFGFSRPRIDLPETGSWSPAPERYEGVYEELATRMVVCRVGENALIARVVSLTDGDRKEKEISLVPLGVDRFLVNPIEGPDPHRGVVDMAFFGDDGTGRATNALNLVFPMRRVE